MQNMKSLLPETSTSLEKQSGNFDERSFEKRQVDRSNAELGRLNTEDGIDCPDCKNKGVIYEVKYFDGDPIGSIYVKPCECMKQRNAMKYAKKSGMGDLLNSRVNGFVATEQWQIDIKKEVANYITSNSNDWFCLLGQSGAGKTHLCSAVANAMLSKGIEVRYCIWGIMTKDLKQDMFSATGTRKLLGEFQNVPVLYIDDLFKSTVNEQDVSLMFDLINYRYNNKLVTLITSERYLGELADIDTAIAGRISERCGKYLFQLTGKDKNYRFKQGKDGASND